MDDQGEKNGAPWPRRSAAPPHSVGTSDRVVWTIQDEEREHLSTRRPYVLSERDGAIAMMPPGIHGPKVLTAEVLRGGPSIDALARSLLGTAPFGNHGLTDFDFSRLLQPPSDTCGTKLTSAALYEGDERTPIISLPQMKDEEWNASGGIAAQAPSFAWKVRAPPVVQSSSAKTLQTTALCPLPGNLQRTRSNKKVLAWNPKDADKTPVTKPFPSELLLPSLVEDDGFRGSTEDEDEDEDDDIIPRLLCKPSSSNNGDILRVVSFDVDESPGAATSPGRHSESLVEGGGNVLSNTSTSSEREHSTVGRRQSPSPRRLDFTGAFGAQQDLTICDVVPSTEKLPASCREYALLMGRVLHERDQELAVRKAECVLHFMLEEYKCGRGKVRPDGGMYNKVMHAYSLQGSPDKVEALLKLMCNEYDGGDELAMPNVKHYTTLLHAWQRANVSLAPIRSEAILAKMHSLHESGALPACKPDVRTYTTVLHSWSESHRQDAAVRAEVLFREMKRRYEAGDSDLCPDVLAYSNLINAIISSGGFAHAEDILWEMVDDYMKGNKSCRPMIRNVNSILASWSKSTAPYAPEKAEEIVRRWIRLNESNEITAKPDSYTYCLVLKCWAISTRTDVAERTKKFMKWLQTLAEKGDGGARLEPVKIASCMTAWMNSRSYRYASDFLESTCHDALNGRHNTIPDSQHFKKTIRGLCIGNNLARADSLVRLTWVVKAANLPFPGDTLLLARFVIEQWICLDQPDRAESLLLEMAKSFRKGTIQEYPGSDFFDIVIQAWKKSKFHDKYNRAKLLQEKQYDFKRHVFITKNSTTKPMTHSLKY